jgi:hypothetical protein
MPPSDLDDIDLGFDTIASHFLVEGEGDAVATRGKTVGKNRPNPFGAATAGGTRIKKDIELPHVISRMGTG